MTHAYLDTYLSEIQRAWNAMDQQQVEDLIQLLCDAYQRGARVFIFGNGGSAANASHFCEDMGKGPLGKDIGIKKRIKAISLTDNVPYITAWANDEGYDCIFEQQLVNLAEPEDVAIAISGSGNSPNVIRAIEYANRHQLISVGITGFDGGKLAKLCTYNVHVPSNDMGLVESLHQIIMHAIVMRLKERLYDNEQEHSGDHSS